MEKSQNVGTKSAFTPFFNGLRQKIGMKKEFFFLIV